MPDDVVVVHVDVGQNHAIEQAHQVHEREDQVDYYEVFELLSAWQFDKPSVIGKRMSKGQDKGASQNKVEVKNKDEDWATTTVFVTDLWA